MLPKVICRVRQKADAAAMPASGGNVSAIPIHHQLSASTLGQPLARRCTVAGFMFMNFVRSALFSFSMA
jgi:hypothetical protein